MAGRELTPSGLVEYADGAESSAFAQMLGGLIEANVEGNVDVRRDFERLRATIGIHASDLGELVTLEFEGRRLLVRDGLADACDLTLHANSDALMSLTGIGIGPARVPNYLGEAGRGIMAQVLRGQLRIEGLAGNLTTLNRLTRIFSVR